jgi:hypothetical protein
MPDIGKPLISITPQSTGGGGGVTTIDIQGSSSLFSGNVTNGVPITIDLVDSLGNLIPNGAVTQVGNAFEAEVVDTTNYSVNSVPVSTIDNWSVIDIQVVDKNGGAIAPTLSQVGNVIGLTIAGQTPLDVNATPSGFVANWDTISIDVDDKNGNPITGAALGLSIVGNNIDFNIAGNTPLQVNGGASIGVIPNWDLADILLRDQGANVVPLVSSSISGSQVTLNINNYPAPSGVALKVPPPTQYTIYATGATPEDEGWRWQNGWWNYVAPSSPEKVADLDYSVLSPNYWYTLKYALRVGSTLSTTRFVDILGGQAWAAVNGRDYVTIDKLTGLMFIRLFSLSTAQANWQTQIDNVAALSVTVDGVTYNDWYIPTAAEYQAVFGTFRTSGNWVDPNTSNNIVANGGGSWQTGNYWTSTTRGDLTSHACVGRADIAFGQYAGSSVSKTGTNLPTIAVRNARNLIFAS